jgi:hypothetical protein
MSWVEEQSWFGLEDTLDFNNYYDELTGEILWETKTFDLIPISQMTTSHIQNAMRMCIKNNWRTEYITVFQQELEKRNKQ